jgi:cbb3-type cytochrome c oxidase subunit III
MRRLMIVCGIVMGVSAGVAWAQDAAKIARGKEVYATAKCSTCHSIEGKGNKKGPLDGVGSKLTAEEILLWHTDPKTMSAKTKSTRKPAMTSYAAKLSKSDLDAVVAYMVSLKKK